MIEIEEWIADSNERYRATIKPIGYEELEAESILKTETSGNFPGSPIVLNYNILITNGLIQLLKFTV